MNNPTPILLDTCVLIFLAEGKALKAGISESLIEAFGTGNVHISTGSALELGRLCSQNKVDLGKPPLEYFEEIARRSGIHTIEMNPEILVASSYLPGRVHRDPMDRIFIATARTFNLTLMTRDEEILTYGAQGHVKTLAC